MHIYRINFLFLMLFATSNVFAAYYPTSSWEISSPEDQQVRTDNVDALVNLAFLDDSTQAVVVIKNGKIISEKYAEGYDKNSHGTSWSMAKSYYAALIGISIDNYNNRFIHVFNPHHNVDARKTYYDNINNTFISDISIDNYGIWALDEIIVFMSDLTYTDLT